MDRYIFLEILEGYIVGPWARRILREYWDSIWMVVHVWGDYGAAFKGFRGVTQGDLLYPTILMWWLMQWFVNGFHWWKQAREGRTGG